MGRLGTQPHVVSVFDLGRHEGQPFIVTELMGGGDVEGLLEEAEGPLPTEQALEIAKGVTRGLAFAHEKGIVHRDIKPGNVWLTEDGVAKIGDLGLAVSMASTRLTQHGMMVGTVAYMPPEQALGGETMPQADLYSLGAMLYELVTGQPPFEGDDPTAVISQHINMRDLDKAVLLAERAVDFARSHRLPVEEDAAWAWVAGVAFARADYERLEQVIEEFPGVTFPKNMTVTAWRILRGDELDEESLPAVAQAGRQPGLSGHIRGVRARAFMHAGREEQAREEYEQWEHYAGTNPTVQPIGLAGEAIVALGSDEMVRAVYDRLRSGPERYRPTSADDLSGRLALRLDLVAAAEQHFGAGLEWSERERCPIEQGRNLQGLAEVAERRGEQQQAMEHLDQAGELFSRYGAKLYLDQVLVKKGILKA